MRQEKYQDDHELKLDLLFVCVINGKDIILVFMQLTYSHYMLCISLNQLKK